ncbi:tetratricopeptide repeat protein [Nodosilinea sp. LEGE 07298]|uniref:CHAT domain-containing protein n=1 Tax=Nodosilinea sp. LEGE 07298 TaxID=2777970 RepID=UPI001882CA3E|nr:CHAT domain-containing protein [Nodosilinea sp. LEGE 07298]MBE9107890.1 tetratricopeptide repeat protein [Nodosilinea sp. LEGE 07298]
MNQRRQHQVQAGFGLQPLARLAVSGLVMAGLAGTAGVGQAVVARELDAKAHKLPAQPSIGLAQAPAEPLAEADALNQQIVELYQQGRYAEAIPLAEQVLQLLETALGKTHPAVAASLNNLAFFYKAQGNYSAAAPFYERSLSIFETALGESHPFVADSLNNLAELYRAQGNYSAAAPLYERSLSIRETALGESHPDVAQSLNNLALFYYDQGNYSAAEPLLLRALNINETALGESHPAVATSLNNLAELYQAQGNYSAAEQLFERSLSISETALGETHPDVADSLNGLATLYQSQGNYSAAASLFERSLSISETVLGETHPDVADSLNGLATLYQSQGNYSAAEPLFERSLSIQETALGESHPNVATSLNNLALLYQDQGSYSAAVLLFERSLSIYETALGESHPNVATSLNNLASIYQDQGNYNAAELLFERSLSIFETALGKTHPYVATSLNNLAILYSTQGNTSQSIAVLNRGVAIEETNLALNLAIGSEARKQAYIATLSGTTNRALSLHLQGAPQNLAAGRLALTTVLRRKGRILDAVTDTQQLLRQNLSPELAPLLDRYTAAQSQLATRLYGGLGNQEPAAYRVEIDALRQQVDALETDLSRRSAEFRTATEPVEIEAIQALIPADAALVELVRYFPFDPTGAGSWGSPSYAAYILHSTGDPQWVELGEAATIDEVAVAFLNATRTPTSLTQARALDEQLMAPIRPLLGNATHLLLSPDGQLNLVPFAALVDEQDRYLAETYTLTHLTTGRDLRRLQIPIASRQPPVILANPNYDTAAAEGATLAAGTSASPRPQAEGSGTRATDQRSTDIADLRFGPLPGTEREVNAIAPLLSNPIMLTETEASESALKQVQGPSILHLATHGFFLEDVEFIPPVDSRGEINIVSASPLSSSPLPAANRPTSRENPLLRSGLALAGFNTRDSVGEDGVFTALEAASLDLRGTRLVVLSACETGVGDVANGEGVYGLRRAFVMAGAESQLMSLWKVDDQATADLMERYYQHLLQGEGRSVALRQVQLALLADPAYAHPYYWAAFLFSGDWQPIEAL